MGSAPEAVLMARRMKPASSCRSTKAKRRSISATASVWSARSVRCDSAPSGPDSMRTPADGGINVAAHGAALQGHDHGGGDVAAGAVSDGGQGEGGAVGVERVGQGNHGLGGWRAALTLLDVDSGTNGIYRWLEPAGGMTTQRRDGLRATPPRTASPAAVRSCWGHRTHRVDKTPVPIVFFMCTDGAAPRVDEFDIAGLGGPLGASALTQWKVDVLTIQRQNGRLTLQARTPGHDDAAEYAFMPADYQAARRTVEQTAARG